MSSSSSPPPRRRFLPEPVEISVRSSKRKQPNESEQTSAGPDSGNSEIGSLQLGEGPMKSESKPRGFLPQPVEESTRSSRKKQVEHAEDSAKTNTGAAEGNSLYSYTDDPTLPGHLSSRPSKPARRFAPEPVETATRSSRKKFAPEPVETSVRSSKNKKDEAEDASSRRATEKPRRKFAPEPVETTTRSSRNKDKESNSEDTGSKNTRRKFLPEPVETTKTRRRRKSWLGEDESQSPELEKESWNERDFQASPSNPSRSSSGGRKFTPELLETAKGSYRKGVRSPTTPPSDTSSTKAESPWGSDKVPELGESRFSAAALARRQHEERRQHSFQVPDLPMIESDSGDEMVSEAPSLTHTDTSMSSDRRHLTKAHAEGDSYTDYVLRLAAQTAEKRLQEQAMAAYINERTHEPVDHFAISHDDDDDEHVHVGKFSGENGADKMIFRRSSAADLSWEMENMRKHHAQLEAARHELKEDTAGHSRFSAAALAARHHQAAKAGKKAKKIKAVLEEESELAKMRAAASPPMLGDDLVFPFTISPKMTRCDTDQIPRPRTYDEDEDEADEEGDPQLWHTDINVSQQATAGLWGGLCQQGQSSQGHTPLLSGLVTPAVERDNPFDAGTPGRGARTPGTKTPGRGTRTPGRVRYAGMAFLPLTPPRSSDGLTDAFTSSIDKKLLIERQIEEEFPDRVVTQIYNYLSLGYPSLAHPFDEELSKISRIPVEELRKDDGHTDAKGYVGAPEGEGSTEDQVSKGQCKRWEALRLYVREWARQSPNFTEENDRKRIMVQGEGSAWGKAVRKGSWAL